MRALLSTAAYASCHTLRVNDRHRDDLHEHRLVDAHRERRESNLASIGMETS